MSRSEGSGEMSIVRELLSLEEDPSKGHLLTGSLRGARALEISLGGVAYRAAYVVLKDKPVCLIFMVGPHEGFYAKAERRAKTLRQSGAARRPSES